MITIIYLYIVIGITMNTSTKEYIKSIDNSTWHTLLYKNINQHPICSAIIIGSNYVLTGANCFNRYQPHGNNKYIYKNTAYDKYNIHVFTENNKLVAYYPVDKYAIHPKFNRRNNYQNYNIAIATVTHTFYDVNIIKLPLTNYEHTNYNNKNILITKWLRQPFYFDNSDANRNFYRQTTVNGTITNFNECRNNFHEKSLILPIEPNIFCVTVSKLFRILISSQETYGSNPLILNNILYGLLLKTYIPQIPFINSMDITEIYINIAEFIPWIYKTQLELNEII